MIFKTWSNWLKGFIFVLVVLAFIIITYQLIKVGRGSFNDTSLTELEKQKFEQKYNITLISLEDAVVLMDRGEVYGLVPDRFTRVPDHARIELKNGTDLYTDNPLIYQMAREHNISVAI